MQNKSSPWYRHRWPWLLMIGPAMAAIGCVITIKLAFDHEDQVVISKRAMNGLVVNVDPAHESKNFSIKQ